jgi:hypothetical protein
MATSYTVYIGPHTLDLVPLEGKLYDIENGGLQGFRKDQPNFPAMAVSLAKAMPQNGAAAGIPQRLRRPSRRQRRPPRRQRPPETDPRPAGVRRYSAGQFARGMASHGLPMALPS